jgi:hypothetical protein
LLSDHFTASRLPEFLKGVLSTVHGLYLYCKRLYLIYNGRLHLQLKPFLTPSVTSFGLITHRVAFICINNSYSYVFIDCSLFYDAFPVTSIKWQVMNWKGFGRKRSWHNLRYCLGIGLEGLRKITKTLISGLWKPNSKQECCQHDHGVRLLVVLWQFRQCRD